jgi:hypothetical protein
MYPIGMIEDVVRYSSELVFSGAFTMNDAKSRAPIGCPKSERIWLSTGPLHSTMAAMPKGFATSFVRMGGLRRRSLFSGPGSVNLRKGIDLFIQCAQQILMQTRKRSVRFLARSHKQNFRFFWIGHSYDPKEDMAYSIYLFEQIRRSNLEDHVFFVGELIGLKTAYQTALERAGCRR